MGLYRLPLANSGHFSNVTIQSTVTMIAEREDEGGFTLVEVIVALAILALSATVLFNVISNALQQEAQAQSIAEASSLAQSLLARVGTELPLAAGESTGAAESRFQWRLHTEEYGEPTDRQRWPVAAYQVSAEVRWRDGAQDRSVALTTLRLGPRIQTR
jgi:general secretion pathway protein I